VVWRGTFRDRVTGPGPRRFAHSQRYTGPNIEGRDRVGDRTWRSSARPQQGGHDVLEDYSDQGLGSRVASGDRGPALSENATMDASAGDATADFGQAARELAEVQ
jgi:hypothetical protein